MAVRRWLVIATCLICVTLGTQTAARSATAAPAPGDLVYVGGPQGDLYLIPHDGSPIKRLTFSGGTNNPAWSPDGRTIAYDRGGDIWLLTPGSGNRRLTFHAGSTDPAWSPDGRTIAYSRAVAGGLRDIFVSPAAGGASRRVTWVAGSGCSAVQPSWQPKGSLLAYVRVGACTQGVVVQRPGAAGRLVVADPLATEPAFNAGGRHLLYLSECPPGVCTWPVVWKATPQGADAHPVLTDDDCTEGDRCIIAMVASPVTGWIEAGTASNPDTGAVSTCFQGRTEDTDGNVFNAAPNVCVPEIVSAFDVRLA